jgi:DNA-binding LacI/PurR family transcriptional regulator
MARFLEHSASHSDRVTAVFASNDLMAVGALRGIAARGLCLPADVPVVGFDGVSLSKYTEPPLTTMMQPIREIGKLATELVLARVNGERKQPQIVSSRDICEYGLVVQK